MVRNIESIERKQSHEALLLDVCRQNPHTFISIEDIQLKFGWSFESARLAVGDVRKQLNHDALYTISWEKGLVYEPRMVRVGERIIPSGLRPDPTWLSEFHERRDLCELLQRVRFATVVSETSAAPLLTPSEHTLLIWFLAKSIQNKVSLASELSEALRVTKDNIYWLVSHTAQKLAAETQGEWTIARQRRGGLCYMLQHNGETLKNSGFGV